MTTNNNINLDEERIDALDHLIFRELGQQAQWQQTMEMWEQRARQQHRLRILPVLSNIASVVALFVLGLIVQAMVPGVRISDSLVQPQPSGQTVVSADSTATDTIDAFVLTPADSMTAQ